MYFDLHPAKRLLAGFFFAKHTAAAVGLGPEAEHRTGEYRTCH